MAITQVTQQSFYATGSYFIQNPLKPYRGSDTIVLDALSKLEAPQRLCKFIEPRHYTIGTTIGFGSFGAVFKCGRRQSSQVVAVKVPLKGGENSSWHEFDFLQQLKHKNIVSLEEGYHHVGSDSMILVMPYANLGSLETFVSSSGVYDPKVHSRDVFRQLASGLKYLHGMGAIHCDLKPANVLVYGQKENPEVKISDFGNSAWMDYFGNVETFACTRTFCAPEAYHTRNVKGRSAEMWSLGSILYFLLTAGHTVFVHNVTWLCTDAEENNNIHRMNGWYSWPTSSRPSSMYNNISNAGKDLVHQLLNMDVEKRLTLEGVVKHCWVKQSSNPYVLYERNLWKKRTMPRRDVSTMRQVWWPSTKRVEKLASILVQAQSQPQRQRIAQSTVEQQPRARIQFVANAPPPQQQQAAPRTRFARTPLRIQFPRTPPKYMDSDVGEGEDSDYDDEDVYDEDSEEFARPEYQLPTPAVSGGMRADPKVVARGNENPGLRSPGGPRILRVVNYEVLVTPPSSG